MSDPVRWTSAAAPEEAIRIGLRHGFGLARRNADGQRSERSGANARGDQRGSHHESPVERVDMETVGSAPIFPIALHHRVSAAPRVRAHRIAASAPAET